MIKVLMCENDKLAKVVEIGTEVKDLQEVVKGYFEAIYPFDDKVAILVNEEGKINGMSPNRAIRRDKEIIDIIFGPFFICGLDGENFGSLTEEQAKKYEKIFRHPEVFINVHGEIHGIPYNPER